MRGYDVELLEYDSVRVSCGLCSHGNGVEVECGRVWLECSKGLGRAGENSSLAVRMRLGKSSGFFNEVAVVRVWFDYGAVLSGKGMYAAEQEF